MKRKIARSFVMIISLLTLASLTTYAVFTAAPVTLANNTISTGAANAAICQAVDGYWRTSIDSSFSITNLLPGEENEKELTTSDKRIYLGNDGGNLPNIDDSCPMYATQRGKSVVSIRFVPTVVFTSCPDDAKDNLRLDFGMGDGLRTDYLTLRQWQENTDFFGPVFNKNEARRIQVFVSLDENSNSQSSTCKFDLIFNGRQADEEI